MRKTKYTTQSVGEKVTKHYAEFVAFVKRAEAKAETNTDEALKWWQKSNWSALIGAVVVALAVAFGAWLGRLV